MSILIINPNSSKSITDGLRASLDPIKPARVQLDYFTAPSSAPTGISDFVTAVQTAYICFEQLKVDGAFEKHDGILICCCKLSPLAHPLSTS